MMQIVSTSWCVCTSSIWAIITLLSQTHAESFDFAKCDISDNFRSDLVSASFKSLEAGHGCETNATSSSGQEVHIITVRPQDSDSKDWLTVKLNVHSRRKANLGKTEDVDFKEDARSIVFVLHSPVPVRWQIEMYGVNSQEKHLFVLSKESLIRFQRKRTRLMAKIRKRGLPFSSNSSIIYDWVERRFGAVTSYNEISEMQVKFYVGRDVSATQFCDLNDQNSSRRIFSYLEASKPITGCMSKRRNHHVRTKPVYVIELLEPPEPSPGVKGVDLEIMPYHSGKSIRSKGQNLAPDKDWKFYLVVKSPPSLQWTLHSKKLPGSVDIVVDATADVKVQDVRINTVALRADDMKVTGKQLVEWSQEYIAPVQMYAGIHAANTIKLRVPLSEKSMASTRDGVPISNHISREPKTHRDSQWVSGLEYGKADIHGNLSSFVHITCTDQVMEVKISKIFFQRFGLDETKVTLRDPSCLPTANTDDHIILCTMLLQCGTHSISLDDNTSFTNAVMIEALPSQMRSLLQDELGSGFFDEEETSFQLPDVSLLMDDEDFRLGLFSIPVECVIKTTFQSLVSSIDPNNQQCRRSESQPQPESGCSMKLYTTASFQQAREESPVIVSRNSTIYVKAVATDQDVTLLVDSCWFSASKHPLDESAETKRIISQGCSRDDSLTWIDDPLTGKGSTNPRHTQFGVMIADTIKGHSPLYLHCYFYTCQRDINEPADKCFFDEHVHCQQDAQTTVHNVPRNVQHGTDCGHLTIGPFDLIDKEAVVKSLPGSGLGVKSETGVDDQKRGQQQKIIIEGLDSATVVGIAFAAFAIGILLMGALWFIHSHTGPIKRRASAPREPDASGDLTPNSSSPMTA